MGAAVAIVVLGVVLASLLVAIAVGIAQVDRHDLALERCTVLAGLTSRLLGLHVRRGPQAGTRQRAPVQKSRANSGAPRR